MINYSIMSAEGNRNVAQNLHLSNTFAQTNDWQMPYELNAANNFNNNDNTNEDSTSSNRVHNTFGVQRYNNLRCMNKFICILLN